MEILISMVALLLAALATLPAWPYSRTWGYYPTSACGVAVVGMVSLVVIGRL